VTAVVEDYVTESGTGAEVVDVEVEIEDGMTKVDIVVASSQVAPSVDALAELLAEHLSAPLQVMLLVASTETERATIDP
jgi:galactitol-specific phosphotransferase system IIB component